MSSLDDLIGPTWVYVDGILMLHRNSVNFIGVSAVDNPATKRTDITVGVPITASFLTVSAESSLTGSSMLVAGTGITLTPGTGTLTIASTATGGTEIWTLLSSSAYTHTAPTKATITTTSDLRLAVPAGTPVRVLDADVYCDATTLILDENAVDDIVDNRGYIGYSVTLSGGTYTFHVFAADGTTELASATFVAGDVPTDLEIRTSGGDLWCTRHITTATTVGLTGIYLYKFAFVSAITSSQITLRGHALSTATSSLLRLWTGDTTRLCAVPLFVGGAVPTGTTDTMLADAGQFCPWNQGPAHLVAADFRLGTFGSADYPIMNVYTSGEYLIEDVTLDNSNWLTSTTIDYDLDYLIRFGTELDLTQSEAAVDASNTDLNAVLYLVLE